MKQIFGRLLIGEKIFVIVRDEPSIAGILLDFDDAGLVLSLSNNEIRHLSYDDILMATLLHLEF